MSQQRFSKPFYLTENFDYESDIFFWLAKRSRGLFNQCHVELRFVRNKQNGNYPEANISGWQRLDNT